MRRVDFGPDTAEGADYARILARMQAEADQVAAGALPETFWIGEHTLTVTLGRSLKAKAQLLAPPGSVTVVEVERGGGATLHNLGQVVVYPLLRLQAHDLSPVSYLRVLELIIIEALADDGLEARALEGKTGVWVVERKIASLGVSLVNGVTRHGLALNVDNDLRDFALINPCGFSAETMIKVASLVPTATFRDYKERLARKLEARFG